MQAMEEAQASLSSLCRQNLATFWNPLVLSWLTQSLEHGINRTVY